MDGIVLRLCLLAFKFRQILVSVSLLAGLLAWPPQLPAAVACKPLLSLKNVREIRANPVSPWTWKATIVADRRFCATTSGFFEIDFIVLTEYSPDQQFTEKYRWTAGQFDVAVEMERGEAIDDYRIGFIAPCVCSEFRDPK